MIVHTGVFTWAGSVTSRQVDELTSAVRAMHGSIPGLLPVQRGPDPGLRLGNPDYILAATFEDEATWHRYQARPLHKALVADVTAPLQSYRQSMQTVG